MCSELRGSRIAAMAAHTDTRTHGPGRTRRRRKRRVFARRLSHRPEAHAAPGTDIAPYVPQPEPRRVGRTISQRLTQAYWSTALALHRMQHRPPKTKTAKVVVVVPAHNEEASIGRTLHALLQQTRRPDRIVVVADNCTDRTVDVVKRFGRKVTLIETVGNRDRKVGALRTAWQQYVAYGFDYMLGVDADTVLSKNALEDLERELEGSPKVGGIMARYTFDPDLAESRWARLLIRMQRLEFASWTLDMLHRKRNTYVLGGQATLFRVAALQEVVDGERRLSPWDPEAQVEDMELTWALSTRNWETKVSATARAYAGPMVTVRSLWAQRRKWDEGMIRLLLSARIGQTTIYPWRMQLKMAINALTRVMFFGLLGVSLLIGAFTWNWIWIAPPVMAALLNLKHARKAPGHTPLDLFLAGTLVAVELYLWFRLWVWSTSWVTVVAGIRRDGWARQYKAEGLPAGQTVIAQGEVVS
jgi:biofilm PGA synthesis N-glycosyltransferase PgaC